VPMPVVRQRYGTAVSAEILEQSINDATRQVMTDRGLRPALQPKVDLISPTAPDTAATDLEFKVELELLPDITLPDFSAISLTRLKAEIDPATIETMVENLAIRNRELVELSEEEVAARGDNPAAAQGDVLTIDYVGKVEDTPFPGGTGTDTDVDIGGGSFIPGFAEQLVGLRPGETRTIEVTFPENYGTASLAGKPATFDVTAKRLRRPLVPPINEELATKIGFDSLEELRQAFRDRSQHEYDALSRQRLKRQLLDALAEQANFAAPQGLIDHEFGQIWQRLETDRTAGRLDDDDKGKDDETLKTEYRAIADRRVRLGLLLAEIGRVNNLTVSPEELNRAMRAEVLRYPGQEAQMVELFRKYPHMAEGLRGPILEEKVVDFVLELAKVEDRLVTPAELVSEATAEVERPPVAASDSASGSEPVSAAEPEPASQAEPTAAGEPASQAAAAAGEPASEAEPASTAELVSEAEPTSAAEPASEPATASAAELASEAEPASAAEPVSEAGRASAAELVSEPAPTPEPGPTAKPASDDAPAHAPG